ncbi:LysR family transcriptional regulator [Pantoea sp. A4]|uniref:LysR family transcriptional regulator n=1 Tax=Pantoea sp. A4 TaxID=1225184 RepID=UPI0003724BE4|nr:LysR family transcriptional regulator [Pantoea sp. A4]
MDSLTTLTAFVRTAESLSFTQAAHQLGISASAVGKNVARLEQQLGVRLFHRSTRSVSLTDEGARLLERCHLIFEQLREAEAELTAAVAEPSGRLRVSLPVIGYRLVLPMLAGFQRRYPLVELDLDFSDRMVNVIDEGFDVVIRSGEITDSRLTARTLGTFRFMVCASPEYLQRQGQPALPAELATHQLILFRFPTTGRIQPWELEGMRITGENTAQIGVTLNNIEALVQSTRAGMGISYLPSFVVEEEIKRGELQEILVDHCQHSSQFAALWPTNRWLTPRVRCFIDYLAANWR